MTSEVLRPGEARTGGFGTILIGFYALEESS